MDELTLLQKLVEIRKTVPYLQKDTKGYNYNYVSGSSIISKVREKMDELGVLLYPSIIKDSLIDKYVVSCEVNMTWVDSKSGEKLEVPFRMYGKDDDPAKAFGKALTYSERYFMLKFFNVPTDKDDPDKFQQKNGTETPPEAQKQPINQPKAKGPTTITRGNESLIMAKMKHKGMPVEELLAIFGVEKVIDLPKAKMNDIMKCITDWEEQK